MRKTQVTITIEDSSLRNLMYTLSVQYLLARSFHVAAKLNIGEVLTNEPQSFDDFKHRFENVNTDNLLRLLNFLVHHKVVDSTKKNSFHANNLTLKLTSDNEKLILTEESWIAQGDLLEYLMFNQSDINEFLEKDFKVKLHSNTFTIQGDVANVAYLYSRFHLVSRALHTVAQLDVMAFVNSTLEIDLKKLSSEKSICIRDLTVVFELLEKVQLMSFQDSAWVVTHQLSHVLGDAEETLQPAFCMVDSAWWNSVSQLEASIRTTECAFTRVNGMSFFEYLKENPAAQQAFDTGLGCFSKNDDHIVAQHFDFLPYKKIVDVAGGFGGLIVEILHNHRAKEQVCLFDQPQVLRNANKELTSEGHHQNVRLVPGDLFAASEETRLPKQHDLYIIKGVLHDFEDDKVVQALKNIAHVMTNESDLLVVERSLDNSTNTNFSSDILMLILFCGRERSLKDWLVLFRYAGLTCFNDPLPLVAGDFSLMLCKKYQPMMMPSNGSSPINSDEKAEKIDEELTF